MKKTEEEIEMQENLKTLWIQKAIKERSKQKEKTLSKKEEERAKAWAKKEGLNIRNTIYIGFCRWVNIKTGFIVGKFRFVHGLNDNAMVIIYMSDGKVYHDKNGKGLYFNKNYKDHPKIKKILSLLALKNHHPLRQGRWCL